MPARKIIYIIGLDRSGSTITGATLGNHPEIVHFGELQFYAKAILGNRILKGGQTINEATFWSNINSQFKEKFGDQVFADFFRLKNKYERWRNFPLLLFHAGIKHAGYLQYLHYNTFLFDALVGSTSSSIICDSSKNAVRRIALGLSRQFEFKTIYLIRDVRGYCWSKKKIAPPRKLPFIVPLAALIWNFNNLLFSLIAILGKFLPVAYESLYREPLVQFERIGNKINCELSELADRIEKGLPINTGNVIAGSRSVRNKTEVMVEVDQAWEHRLSKGEKMLIWILGGWLMLIFKALKITKG